MYAVFFDRRRFSPLFVHFEDGVMCKILLSSPELIEFGPLWAVGFSLRDRWKWYLVTYQWNRLVEMNQ